MIKALIYNNNAEKGMALTKLAYWYEDIEKAGFKSFNTIANSFQLNYATIVNYFENRSTNATAESFNAKIKVFRITI